MSLTCNLLQKYVKASKGWFTTFKAESRQEMISALLPLVDWQ